MKPATHEAALELVATIIDRGLRRREQRSTLATCNATATAPNAKAS